MIRVLSTLLLALLAFALREVGTHRPAAFPQERPPELPEPASLRAGYETTDAWLKLIAACVAGLFAAILAIMAASAWMYARLYDARPAIHAPAAQGSFTHAPQARSGIARDWEAIHRETHERLQTYGWIDRGAGVLRVPIDRAMEIVAREGLPARQGRTPDFPPPENEKIPLLDLDATGHAQKSY